MRFGADWTVDLRVVVIDPQPESSAADLDAIAAAYVARINHWWGCVAGGGVVHLTLVFHPRSRSMVHAVMDRLSAVSLPEGWLVSVVEIWDDNAPIDTHFDWPIINRFTGGAASVYTVRCNNKALLDRFPRIVRRRRTFRSLSTSVSMRTTVLDAMDRLFFGRKEACRHGERRTARGNNFWNSMNTNRTRIDDRHLNTIFFSVCGVFPQ